MNVTHFGDAKKSIQSFDIHPSCKRVAIAYEQDITLWSSNSSNERSGNHRRIPTNAFRRDLRSTARESNFKFIKWLDDDVLANNALFENIKDVDNDDEVKSKHLKLDESWLVVCSETQCWLYNYLNSSTLEIKLWGEKKKNCIASICILWATLPVIVFGCGDGSIRTYDIMEDTVQDWDNWNQNKALINIVGLTDISGIDTRIITASVGGLLQLWDFNTHSILANVKAHPDFISFCYVPGGDLYTVGTDKQISVWNTSNLQRKLGRKCSNVCALEAFPHSNVGSHKFILATSDSLSCFVSDCESGSGQVLFNLSSFSQSLRRPKITSISVSKIHPERIFVAINKCVLFAVEWGKRFLPSPQFARMGSPTDSEVWTESKGHIWRTSYNGILTNVHSTSKKCGCWHDQVLSAPSGVLSRSFDDTFACVFCPEEGRFTIFRTLNWSVLMKNTEQNVVDFVWSSNCNRAAMVVMKNSSAILKASSASGTSPSSSSPLGSIIPRGSGSSRNNSKLDVLQYACVSILDVDSDGEIIWNGKMTSGYVPRISGGALLGIWKQDALNFYSWNGDMCGRADEQPPVSYLLWEDAKIDGTSRCLTVVDGTTHVYDTKPEFHCIRSFSNLPIIDALWYEDSVFYCTDSDIGVIFPTVDSWPACVIASHTLESCGGPYSTSAKCMKPFGMNKLVGVFEDNLLLVAADFSVKRVSLASPVLQFFLTTANKSLKQAMEKASNIDPMWYERVARFAAGCDENVKSSNQILDEEMYGMTYGEKLEFLEALINGK